VKKDFVNKFMANPETTIKLGNCDPNFTNGISKNYAEGLLKSDLGNQLSDLQYKLFADKSQALLIILQGMDASGKDGTIRHVMKAFNPQSCKIISFKKPNDEETSHDYLWRIHKVTPAYGEIGIFNRSHYEDVLTAKVNKMVSEETCSKRYEQINHFEKYLSENDIKIIKIFLHISKDEQKRRLEKRINDPTKQWKFSESDLIDHALWEQYITAYEVMLNKCNNRCYPWHIIPSNNKWFRNFAVAQIIIHTLEKMNLEIPMGKFDFSRVTLYD
jgi:PPK2 family polyphosphate:nucleotide phosphotransferase